MDFFRGLGVAFKGLFNSTSQRDNQTERALRATNLAIVVGLLGLLFYAYGTTEKQQLKIAIAGLLAAGAACAVGALLGLLFGIPRSLQETQSQVNPEAGSEETPTVAGNASKTSTNLAPRPLNSTLQANVLPNTNLEQISDWLTKILVGISLTRFTEIQTKFLNIARAVARSLNDAPEAFAAALLLFFMICGFLKSYLWARRYLEKEFGDASRENQRIQAAREEGRKEMTEALNLATQLNAPRTNLSSQLERQMEEQAKGEGIESLAARRNFTPPSAGPNAADPWKGQFGKKESANNRTLSAEVTEFPSNPNLFNLVIRVRSTDPINQPLGSVKFFLHPTFPNSSPVVAPGADGVAELRLVSWGAFTVGAMTDDGETLLELDLAELKGAPQVFCQR